LAALIVANAQAFDSSSAYNTITFSYVDNAFVGQNFVLSSAQKSSATSFKLTVDAKDGGGRPTHNLDGSCAAYCSQYDTAEIRIIAYNSSGAVVSTKSVVQNLKNWGSSSNPGWSVAPGDNQFDWTQMTVSVTAADVGGSFANVSRIRVELVNKNEGSYWNGNYGVQFRTPTLQVNGTGSNLLYNSEFGVDSTGVKAQGWAVSYSSYNSCSGTASNQVCVTVEPTVTANMWGGGYDPNGGTVNSQPGGYESVLTSDNADTAAEGGDITSGGSSSSAPTPVYSSGITAAQSTRKSAVANRNGHVADIVINGDDNLVNIQQISGAHYFNLNIQGSDNTVNTLQTTTVNAKHYLETGIIGSNNTVNINQKDTDKTAFTSINGHDNSLVVLQEGTGNHYLNVNLIGNSHTATINQTGSGTHAATVELTNGGGAWNFQLNQSGTTGQTFSLPHTMTDNSSVSGTCATPAGCNLTVNQQ
jgi:hypothetical protein